MNTSTERVALYARISQDTSGEAVGVSDQLEHARAFAAARGYTVVAEHSDNDISAFKGAERPGGYQKVLQLAREHRIDRVVVYHMSRMTRNRRERAEFIDGFHAAKVSVSEAQGADYDLTTASGGRSWADIQGALSTWESEIKSERVTAAACGAPARDDPLATSDTDGRSTAPERRPAGLNTRTRPQSCARLSTGCSVATRSAGITDDLNRRGEPAPKTARWGKTSVKKLALRESNIAQRIHHRGQPDEERFDGCWPAIVDRAKHEKVVALLTGSGGRQTNGVKRRAHANICCRGGG